MSYETSYDTGFKPFNHDRSRGKWSHPSHFLFACIGHAFKADTILFVPLILFRELGIYSLIPYILISAICVVPIAFIQSFLGQFSGTGFISVFRIAPLFKGIGYVSLAFNLITLAYYSIFSAIPLFYLFYTLQPTIPWSCEGLEKWLPLEENLTTPCSRNDSFDIESIGIPSVEFFRTHLDTDLKNEVAQFSWLLVVCSFIVWIIVLLVSLRPVETIGRFIKYSYIGVIGVLSVSLIRFLFLPHALVGLRQFFLPFPITALDSWFSILVVAFATLGPGWGSILTMASFNDFKTNIYRYSWIMSFAQLGIVLGISFMSMLMWGFLLKAESIHDVIDHQSYQFQFTEILIIPTGLTFLELPHFWSVIFFGMVLLGTLSLLIVQLLSMLTSLFDEFESLRARKKEITLGVVGALALCSIYFCSNHGFEFISLLAKSSLITQMIFNLLLILVVLWIYGRERFQRDVNFMTSRLFSAFMTNIVRFVTPLFVVVVLLIGLLLKVAHFIIEKYTIFMIIIAAAVAVLPWCLIPWYCVARLMQTNGILKLRFKRCVRPTDWYPADPLYKQRYEETFSNPEASHHLTMTTEE